MTHAEAELVEFIRSIDPEQLNPEPVEEVREAIRRYYALPGYGTGGSLHIVLDDHNLERDHLAWCSGYASGKGDEAGRELARLLLDLPVNVMAEAVLHRG